MIGIHVEKFLLKVPFFRLLLALVSGILFYTLVGFNQLFFLFSISFGVILMTVSFLIKNQGLAYKFRWFFGIGVFFFLFALGMFITNKAEQKTEFKYNNKKAIFLCKVIDTPIEKPKSVLCKVQLLAIIDGVEKKNLQQKAIVYFQKDNNSLRLPTGQKLLLNTTFTKPTSTVNPYEFDYANYLKYQGFASIAYLSSDNWQKTGDPDRFSLIGLSHQCREKLLSIYQQQGISGNEFAVLSALTLGYKDALNDALKDDFSACGVMHVLVVSGLHVGILCFVLNFVLSFLDKSRKTKIIKTIFIILFLWMFAFITGLSTSVVRVSLMFSLVSFSFLLNRKSQIYNTIFLSAFVMLLYRPYFLFDVGFQLSYSAVIGIVFFQPKFYGLLKIENKILQFLWSLFTISVAAQLSTAPLGIYYFHQFSSSFWLANMIVVPISTIAIYLAISLLFFCWIPYLNIFIATVLIYLLKGMNATVAFIHHLPFSVVENVWLEKSQVFLLFLCFVVFSIAILYRKYWMFVVGFCSLIFFISINLYINNKTLHSNRLIVEAVKGKTAVAFVKQQQCYVITNDSVNEERAMKNYRMRNRIKKPILLKENIDFMSFAGKRILILSDNTLENKVVQNPISVDYVVLTNKVKISVSELLRCVSPKKIIVDMSFPQWEISNVEKDCQRMGIDYYIVSQKGAFVADL
jgi:competence protein ComEC